MASAEPSNVNSDSVDDLDDKTGERKMRAKDTRPTFGFDLKTPKTDLVLVFNKKKMYVTKVVLEMASPVFRKMFAESFDESHGNEIKIEGKDYHVFAEFLACIYPGIMLKVTIENVYRLMSLAFEFEVEYLKDACQSVLAKSLKDKHDEANLFKCMGVAYKHNIKALKTECLKQAIQIYEEDISRTDELLLMKGSYRPDIWKSIFPGLRSDASKFRFLAAAANHLSGNQSNFENFNDAKYITTDLKIDWYKLWNNGEEIDKDLPRMWGDYRLCINVKIAKDATPRFNARTTNDVMQFVLYAKHDHGSAQCLASFVIEFINIIPWNNNLFLRQSCGTITTNTTLFISTGPENFQDQWKGFVLDGQVKVRIHLLVNKPTLSPYQPETLNGIVGSRYYGASLPIIPMLNNTITNYEQQ